jgi:hypothetical protein
MAKQGRVLGRPRKPEAQKVSRSVYLRSDAETEKAVTAYQKREDISTMSEAVRRLVRKSLKAEGLL